MNNRNYIFIVQVTRQLCVDILNEFADKGASIELYTGEISNSDNSLNQNIKVHYLCKYNRGSFFKRLLTWFFFTTQIFFKLLFKPKKAELIFISTPPITPFLGLFYKKIFHQKYHLIIWDLYPQALQAFRKISNRSMVYQSWSRANKPLFNNSESIITIGQHMAESVKNTCQNKSKIKIVYNWIDIKYITPIAKTENWFAQKYNQIGKLTVMYSGNMGDTHDFDTLLEVAEILKEEKEINFLIIGDGVKRQFIEKNIDERKLHNVLLLSLQDRAVFPYSIATADLGVVTLGKEMGDASVPSKTYSILAAGSALLVLGPLNSELSLIVNKYDCGATFKNDDVKGITNFVLKLSSEKSLLETYKKKSRLAAQDFTPTNARQYYKYISNSAN